MVVDFIKYEPWGKTHNKVKFYPLSVKMSICLSWLAVILLKIIPNVASGQVPPQGFRYASYDVTIPRKLSPKYGQEEPQDVTYLLQIEGNPYVVYLRQKRNFIPKDFPVFTYDTVGNLQVDHPFIKDDCFYHGFVQRKSSSVVTLSTCSGGLRGLLQFENKTYEIEPIQESPMFQHVVFRLEEEEGALKMTCGLTKEEQSHQKVIIPKTEKLPNKPIFGKSWWPHTRYIKLAIVIDHERYLKFNRNESVIIMQVLNIVHTANSLYESLSVHLSMAGLEIWSQNNLINISDQAGVTLSVFSSWRQNTLHTYLKNDAGHLLLYKTFNNITGFAYIGTICDRRWASGVVSYVSSSLFYISLVLAHEIGHNLGMKHDGKFCICEKHSCVMAPTPSGTDKFSNCSYMDYFKFRNTHCLLVPPDTNTSFKFEFCGNKVVENAEQCDCGSEVQCNSDPCCQSNCKLRPGAVCASGQCCANCQYRELGTVCRESTSGCDLPEYCSGTSERCPEDMHVQDGAPCSHGVYCYRGSCLTHDMQCKMIFGSKATVASEVCFRLLNDKGDRFGNCGLKYGTYKKCDTQDIMCGRIQCKNVDSLPSLEDHNTIVHTSTGDNQCWGTDYHSGMKVNDIGAVRDGIPCGNGMMCIEGSCVNVSLLKYDCNVTMCQNRGICNTLKHCHCRFGWAPPDCRASGYGGSIDSGPPPPQQPLLSNSGPVRLLLRILWTFSIATQ
ncbi:disintegrin and metalloproteinase domain-containing protein 20-like [Candoia aspera]|uniref:disintegrin and metalloproteinase domain-containing protein 20-like n=1 Tax=Candoia aspera TaxID=51853 RepID=UPI002FD832B8